MKLYGERLLFVLEEKNITQRALAKAIHIAPNTLNGYIHQQNRQINDDLLDAIAEYLNVSTDYLAGKTSQPGRYGMPRTHGETIILNNYRKMNSDNQKLMETLSYHLLTQQSE